MKKIATILCILFVLVQIAPAVCTVLQVGTGIFMVDEEKSPEKMQQVDNKDIKSCLAVVSYNQEFERRQRTAFQLSEKIQLSPCLEKLTPPPNFS